MTARSNTAVNRPTTSVPLILPATLENSGTSQVNGPLPTILACSIRSVPGLQIDESKDSKFSNPLSAQGTATTTNKRDYSTESAVSRPPSPTAPIQGEAPNDMIMRMFNLWSEQLADSYRPNVQVSSEATAENNLKLLQELYPPNKWGAGGGLTKAQAAGVVVERVCHFAKKMLYKHVARSLSVSSVSSEERARFQPSVITSPLDEQPRSRQSAASHEGHQDRKGRSSLTSSALKCLPTSLERAKLQVIALKSSQQRSKHTSASFRHSSASGAGDSRREAREAARDGAQKRPQKGRFKESRTSIHTSHTSHRRASHR